MIRRSRAQYSSLFLMELIIAILFFSLTSAVCVQFFVKSHLLSQKSKILSQAVNECSNIAETADSSDSTRDALSLLRTAYPGASLKQDSDSSAVIYYDDAFSPCDEATAAYSLKAAFIEEDLMLEADMKVTDSDGAVIYELNTNHHIARRTGYEER